MVGHQLDDSKPLHRKWLFHQTSILNWLLGVPGLNTLPKTPKRKSVPQSPFFKGYVSFTECIVILIYLGFSSHSWHSPSALVITLSLSWSPFPSKSERLPPFPDSCLRQTNNTFKVVAWRMKKSRDPGRRWMAKTSRDLMFEDPHKNVEIYQISTKTSRCDFSLHHVKHSTFPVSRDARKPIETQGPSSSFGHTKL